MTGRTIRNGTSSTGPTGGIEQADRGAGPRRSPLGVTDLLSADRDAISVVRWSQIAVVFQSALQP